MKNLSHYKIVILAGGRGTRLWPLSRKQRPKQFQKLISDKTMLQETVERLLPRFSLRNIFIATNIEYKKEIRREFPKIPQKILLPNRLIEKGWRQFLFF